MIHSSLREAKANGQKQFAVLVDPDKITLPELERLIILAVESAIDYFLIGSSLLMKDGLEACLDTIRQGCRIPKILFPGNALQLSDKADSILLLSLISGRNPELLIGQHVIAAPYLRQSGLEILPTAYMLIDGGVPTSVSYMSNTNPIPRNKKDIAQCTAMAGEMLGLQLIYLDAGSGARHAIKSDMIEAVSQSVKVPVIVGGGIRNPESAQAAAKAGADLIIVGNAIEKNPGLLGEMTQAVHSLSTGVGKKVSI
ncbi:MAG: geranylgeranylglyceryl phosphate synthase [Saprospiraceae bacterium]|nr:MAG: geranylgeranylglyceryl phosphate synthase [Saprospiraceae bacterium]